MLVKLYAEQAAARVGLARQTWAAYRNRGQPVYNPVPEPDGTDIESGHARPWWYESTVDGWAGRRPGKGGRPKAA